MKERFATESYEALYNVKVNYGMPLQSKTAKHVQINATVVEF